MKLIEADTFAELYSKAIDLVYNHPEFETHPRGLKIKECLNVMMRLKNPASNLFKSDNKSLTLQTGYLKRELSLYLNGTNDATLFGKASPFWLKIKNDDNTINSAYGNLIFAKKNEYGYSEFEWIVKSLEKDHDSRLAIAHFNASIHQYDGVKDFPCTLTMTFHIRNDKLYATTVMRSNDIRKGLQYDLPFFTLVLHLVYLRLKDMYPELELGDYVHLSQSLHIYDSDFEYAKSIIENKLLANSMPMPADCNTLIMSNDIQQIVNAKFNGQSVDVTELYAKNNIDFYSWLMS